jgi:hypothetical protein
MTVVPLRRVTPRDINIIQRVAERDRHLALFALISETSLASMHDKPLNEIARLLPADENGEPSVVIADGAGDMKWRDASNADRAPILDKLASMFAEHLAESDGNASTTTKIEYVDVAAPVTVTLSYPFEIDGAAVREVSLRPPRYGDVESVLAGRMERSAMISEMSGMSVDAINALRWPDAERIVGIAMDMSPQFAGV